MAFRVGSLVTPIENFDSIQRGRFFGLEIVVSITPAPKIGDIAEVISMGPKGLALDMYKIEILEGKDFVRDILFNPEYFRELLPPQELVIEEIIKEPMELLDSYV